MKASHDTFKNSPGIGHKLLPLILFLAPVLSYAQQVEATKSDQNDEEEILELSPFQVSTSKNVGYLANNTLAGTRINADLKNIANSVQVLTKEFLEDTGATDLSELLNI